MAGMNGTQLYGLRRLAATLRMSRHPALKGLSIKQKLALNHVAKQSKLTRLDGQYYANTFTPPFPSEAYDRYLAGVISVCSGRPLPIITNFALTAKCPCHCWHCSFASRAKKNELSLAEVKEAIAQVKELGSSVIGFTGGEPLLRDDLEEIIAAAAGACAPLLFTTGFGLTPARARALKQAGLLMPVISLDHYTAEAHDRGRGRQGMFDTAREAIGMFQDEGLYVSVSFVPERQMVEQPREMWRTIEFFKELGVNDLRLTSPILSGRLTARPEEKLTPKNVRTIFDIQRRCTSSPGYPGVFAYDYFESEKFYGCGAGFNYLFIDAEGNLCPCDFTMISFGNLRERPLAEIWAETWGHFRQPGRVCYANVINDNVAARNSAVWPLGPADSQEVHGQCPSFDAQRLPEFYRRMSFTPPAP
jgi:MoaA/NifB/PqqE/SkfB family radical SAM enzyme